MAKSASPIRLQEELMRAATLTGERQHRSTAEQIEYWASIGRTAGKILNPDNLLAVVTGIAKVVVEPITANPLDPGDVFAALERDRNNGVLEDSVSSLGVRYQASSAHPGYLEQIESDGSITVGRFSEGTFTAKEVPAIRV